MSSYRSGARSMWQWAGMIIWIRQQLLLVPEAILLLALICLHLTLDGSVFTTLAGLTIVTWFGCRMALILSTRRALHQARYARAERLVRLALWFYPYSADALALRGAILMAQGRMAEAEPALCQAIAFYPGQATLHVARSGVLLELDRGAEAYCEAMRAILLDPGCAAAYLHLAHAAQQIGEPDEVIETHLRMGLRATPDPADEAALRCTLAAFLVDQHRLAEARLALAGIEALLARCAVPQRAGLHYYLGELRRMVGDTETAHHHFRLSEALDPHGRYTAAAWRAARWS